MPIDDNIKLIRSHLVTQLVSQRMIADFNVHNPGQDPRNGPLHAHVMTTLRFLDKDETFREKCLDWRGPAYLRSEQKAWANFVRNFMNKECAWQRARKLATPSPRRTSCAW